MKPTDVSNPEYFHKVVDCQWGCPAHTDVPQYIRLIAQGQFTDAYMLNRESNVFPATVERHATIVTASRQAELVTTPLRGAQGSTGAASTTALS